MRTAEEILRDAAIRSGLYFNDDGKRMVLMSEAISSINKARKEAIEECAKVATVTDEQWQGKNDVYKQSILNLINTLK